jgi:peroxiredoxin
MKWRGLSVEQDGARRGVSLAQRLLEIRAGIVQYVRPENQAINERAVAELEASGIAERILPVGAKAPEFTLPDQNGKMVSSAALLSHSKLIINFYRGRWCPFCVTELETYRDMYEEIRAAGASLIAISPQTVKHSAFTADQHKLRFPILSDAGNSVARQFALVYRVPAYQEQLFRSVFINLPLTNGDESWELPLPATYVIGQDGTVLFAQAFADYTKRPEMEQALAFVENSDFPKRST